MYFFFLLCHLLFCSLSFVVVCYYFLSYSPTNAYICIGLILHITHFNEKKARFSLFLIKKNPEYL